MTTISLSGNWDFCPLIDPNAPASLPPELAYEPVPFRVPSSWRWVMDERFDFQPYDLFEYPRHWNNFPAAFLRKQFSLNFQPGERIWLTFQGVLQRWGCWVNGVRQGELISESFLPVTFDITEAIRPRENELIVWCGAWEKISTPAGMRLTNPNGSWFAELARGIWQDVTIETRPAGSITDVAVRTSTRRGEIQVEITAANFTGSPLRAEVAAEIFDNGINVGDFEPLDITLHPHEKNVFSLAMAWKDAIRWSPANPHLYELRVALTPNPPLASGEGHGVRARFGFREVWFDEHIFYLNGARVNLRGDAWHYQGFACQSREYARAWFERVKAAGGNFVRLHAQPYPEFFLDVADEMGMLVVDESAIYGSSKTTASDDPAFLENCRAHLERLVRRDRNHPSVVMWSMQNEMRWVDGREGYRNAMPALTAAMRALDPTRPIVYDGDKHLAPPEWCEAFSLHYNIDGTVDGWDRSKPLLFGEHGAFHYVSPQVSADIGGQGAYLSFERAIQSIGENERLFIEYARRREVTGLTPFNLVNYAHWTLPPRHIVTLAAGAAPRPNPAFEPLAAAFAPITILPNELNTVFYSGRVLRSFSLFNDTEKETRARLTWTLAAPEGEFAQGEMRFTHAPGCCVAVKQWFNFPEGDSTLTFSLFHDDELVCVRAFSYKAVSQKNIAERASNISGAVRYGFYGSDKNLRQVTQLVPATRLEAVTPDTLRGVDVLVLGEKLRLNAESIAPALDEFVRAGGSLLVLEQDELTFEELTLSGRKFFIAHPNPENHPIFDGLTAADLRFWTPDNPHADHWRGLVNNAFIKPVDGDVETLLECAEGAFGWGGLLWTPLVSYRLGRGRAIFCQVALGEYFESAPQAVILLGNLLKFAGEKAADFRAQSANDIVCRLTAETIERARAGETLVIQPLEPADEPTLNKLLGVNAVILESDTYQLAQSNLRPSTFQPFHNISAHDLFHIERVTYTPKTYSNRVIARHAIQIPSAIPLLTDVHNPWRDFFINGMDGEWLKMAVATQCHDSAAEFTPRAYAVFLPIGRGGLVFCQILPEMENPKIRRIYNRLYANLGAKVDCDLFTRFTPVCSRGIPAMMGLARLAHQDETAMREYFSAPGYALNHLGEGVFGWMLRLEAQHGVICIPDSANQTWFLTVFIESDINRDPSQRASGELPDPSIVPDLWVNANCPVTVILNGQTLLENGIAAAGGLNVGDALLQRGLNRLAFICRGGAQDIQISAWLLSKLGEAVTGIHTHLTLD